MKIRVVWRNVIHYIRTDLKEIAFPSSLPDPPSTKPKPRKLKLREHFVVLRTATRLYVQSWRTGTVDFDDDEEDEKKESKHPQPKKKNPDDPSIVEELALAARAGSESLRPALQRVYMTRASAYRDALQSFVRGYQEGIGEVMGQSQSTKDHMERGTAARAPSPEDGKPNVPPPVSAGQPAEKIQQDKGVET